MIVMISGKMGSGKSSLSNRLAEHYRHEHGYITLKMKFAEPLYEMQEAILTVLKDYGIYDLKDKYGDLLQYLGTEFIRNEVGEHTLTNIMKTRVDSILKEPVRKTMVIIDDMRFEDEFNLFQDSFKIRLECKEDIRLRRVDSARKNTKHRSETGLDEYVDQNKFDFYIFSDELSAGSVAKAAIVKINERIADDKEKAAFKV